MKILSGVPNHLHNEIAQFEVQALKERGIDVVTASYGNSGEVTGVILRLQRIIKNAVEIANKAAEQRSDIIYLNTAFDKKTVVRDAITLLILECFNQKKKVVLKLHGSEKNIIFKKNGVVSFLKNYLINRVRLLLVLSNEERKNFITTGVSPRKLSLTANPIEKKLYRKDESFKSRFGIVEESPVLLFVGRFIKEKGILDVIEACNILKKKGFDYMTICVGGGPLEDLVKGKIDQYGLHKNVILTGYIPEAETKYYYSNCDILVLPTFHEEGFPMAVFQAVAAGKAVITTKIRAAADYFKEYENCLWVERENAEQLAEKILELASNKLLLKKMEKNNLVLADQFSKENVASGMIGCFEQILKGK